MANGNVSVPMAATQLFKQPIHLSPSLNHYESHYVLTVKTLPSPGHFLFNQL